MGCRPLGECIESVIDHRGLTPKKLGGDWAHSGHRALSAKNIKNGALVQEGSMNRVSDEIYYRWMTEEVERGDVFITSEAPFGEVLYWDSDEKLVLSQRIFGLKVNRDVCDSHYLYYWMRSPFFQGELRGRATGTTVTGLRQPELLKCMVHLPPRDVQAAIAHILGTIDDKIMFNNQTNGYLAEIADALFTDAFGNLEDNAVLSDIANITMGQSPAGTSYNEEGVGTVFYQGRGEFGWRYPTQRLFTTEPKRMAKSGDVLMSVRAPVGDLNLAYEDCCIGRGLVAISCDYPSYCLYLMRSLGNKLDAYNGEGTVFGSISGKALKGIGIVLPGNDDIAAFEAMVAPIDAQIRCNETESRILSQLRDVLLPKLMSGEIDVSKVDLTQLNSHLA